MIIAKVSLGISWFHPLHVCNYKTTSDVDIAWHCTIVGLAFRGSYRYTVSGALCNAQPRPQQPCHPRQTCEAHQPHESEASDVHRFPSISHLTAWIRKVCWRSSGVKSPYGHSMSRVSSRRVTRGAGFRGEDGKADAQEPRLWPHQEDQHLGQAFQQGPPGYIAMLLPRSGKIQYCEKKWAK